MSAVGAEIRVSTSDVEGVASNVRAAAKPIQSCVDSLDGVSVNQPGFATASAAASAAKAWGSSLASFASGFSGYAARIEAGKGHYVMAEATNTGRFQPAG
jgi:hypothetical protein